MVSAAAEASSLFFPASVSVSGAGFQKESSSCKENRKDELASKIMKASEKKRKESTYIRGLVGGAEGLEPKVRLVLHLLASQLLDQSTKLRTI